MCRSPHSSYVPRLRADRVNFADVANDFPILPEPDEMRLASSILCVTLMSSSAASGDVPVGLTSNGGAAQQASERIDFQIPSVPAERALEIFAANSNRPLIYLVDQVRGVQLQAVSGLMPAEQALRLMLEGTELEMVEDSESEALVIRRIAAAPETADPGGSLPDLNPTDKETMKVENNPRRNGATRFLRGLGALVIAGTALNANAQEVADAEEEIITLSPFTVDADADVGYQAQSTLAGSRLATDVRELASSISIATVEFMEDTGATDSQSLLTYMANTEVGGALGNYSAGGGVRFAAAAARRNPQNAQRIRGLASAELTRDYFSTRIPFDQYNSSRVTVARGPNAALFGIGSVGGVIDQSPHMAAMNSNFTEVSARVGHRGSYRGTFDLNRSLINDRVSVRLSGLTKETKFKQEPAKEEDDRIYAALNAVLFENANNDFLGQTVVRASYETGEIFRNPPDVIPPVDSFRYWFQGYGDIDSLLAVPGIELSDLRSQIVPQDRGGNFIPNYLHDNIASRSPANTSSAVPVFVAIPLIYESGDQQRSGFADPAFAGFDTGMARHRWPGSSGRVRQDLVASGNAIRRLAGFTSYSLQNPDIFDYRNNLLQGTLNSIESAFSAAQATFEQSFWDNNAGVEVTYNDQTFNQQNRLPLSTGLDKELYIDISQFQTNDAPNPNVGRPALRVNNFDTDYIQDNRESVRATAFFKVDTDWFSESLGKWLGDYTITGFRQDDTFDNSSRTNRIVWDSNQVAVGGPGVFEQPFSSGRSSPKALIYVGPSAQDATDFNQVRITDTVNIPWPEPGETYYAWYWDHQAKERKEAEFFTRDLLFNGDISRLDTESEALLLQSSILNDYIFATFAWREDRVRSFGRQPTTGDFGGDNPRRNPNGELRADTLVLDTVTRSDETVSTRSLSFVGFFPEEHLFELPFGMDLSAHYYEGNTFDPVGFRQNIKGEAVSNPNGTTEEYGFSMEFLDRRLSLRVNWFETAVNGISTGANGALSFVNLRPGDWLGNFRTAQAQGIPFDQLGVPASTATSYDEVEAVIHNLLPEPTRSLRNFQVDSTGFVTSTPIQNLTATLDFVSEGMEVELVGQITPNWSVAFNLAQQETVTDNVAPALRDVLFELESNLAASGLGGVPDAPHLGVAITFDERTASGGSAPLRSELAKQGTKSQEQREWRANLVTNYDFQEGFLRNFGVGGALKWQDRAAIGYPFLLDEFGNQIPDLANAFLGDDDLNGDVWVSYGRKIFNDKVDWRIQLNVRNAIRTSSDIPVAMNPNGELAVVRIPPEQEWFITNTFRF